jgi:hypothetical protein
MASLLLLQTGDYLLLQTGDRLELQLGDLNPGASAAGGATRRSIRKRIQEDDEEVMHIIERIFRQL